MLSISKGALNKDKERSEAKHFIYSSWRPGWELAKCLSQVGLLTEPVNWQTPCPEASNTSPDASVTEMDLGSRGGCLCSVTSSAQEGEYWIWAEPSQIPFPNLPLRQTTPHFKGQEEYKGDKERPKLHNGVAIPKWKAWGWERSVLH